MNQDFILLDGGMGTMLQNAGMPLGVLPETWNITHPETVTEIQRRYVDAGAQVLYANTFGANRHKISGSGYTVPEVIRGGIQAARNAAGDRDVKVALDIGPIGALLEPLGTMTFAEAYDIFREMVVAGEEAGADLVIFETMSDLYEVKAAVLAAKEHTNLPVWVTMTMEATARSFVGVTIPAMALTLTGLGVDALGFNCSLGPVELLPMVEELSRWTSLPMILKPNAGLPDPATGAYTITPEEFARAMVPAAELGVTIFGGCCGTTPDFIAALKDCLKDVKPGVRRTPDRRGVCSGTCTATLDGVRVVGERINPTGKKRFQQALREQDYGYILEKAVEQQDAGAEILDVNVGLPGIDEAAVMARVIREIQAVVELPLQIDSTDPQVLEAGLRAYNGKPIVNSVNGDQETLDAILPLCKKYGAAVVGLCMDHTGIPDTAEKRVEIGRRILAAAESYGIPREDVFLDCLTLTVSAQPDQAIETVKAVRRVREELGLHTVLGVSNISFGLPAREHITVSFLTQAMAAGLDLPIVNPNQKAIMDAISAYRVLSLEDPNAQNYIERFANAPQGEAKAASGGEMTIEAAVLRGLKEETAALTRKALETMPELEVVNDLLIPALDLVGEQYEKQKIFLPQLISASSAACAGFDVVKERIAKAGEGNVSKGKVILATVHGDIHDIGKNIVKVVLENYGFTVIDLGRDVPKETVVEAAIRENVYLVGLSALMTTTVSSMAETIQALRESGHDCKVMVGGAVLTAEYAREIGADYYAKDAKQSADIAKEVLGGKEQ